MAEDVIAFVMTVRVFAESSHLCGYHSRVLRGICDLQLLHVLTALSPR